MGKELKVRELPDGRVVLILGRCVPLVVSLEMCSGHSRAETCRLVGMLTLVAHSFSKEHGSLLPMRIGRFIEDPEAGRFMLAPEGRQGPRQALRAADVRFEIKSPGRDEGGVFMVRRSDRYPSLLVVAPLNV